MDGVTKLWVCDGGAASKHLRLVASRPAATPGDTPTAGVVFSPPVANGGTPQRFYAVGTRDGALAVYAVAAASVAPTERMLAAPLCLATEDDAHDGPVTALAVLRSGPESAVLASAGWDRRCVRLSVAGRPRCCFVSTDERRACCATCRVRGRIRMWTWTWTEEGGKLAAGPGKVLEAPEAVVSAVLTAGDGADPRATACLTATTLDGSAAVVRVDANPAKWFALPTVPSLLAAMGAAGAAPLATALVPSDTAGTPPRLVQVDSAGQLRVRPCEADATGVVDLTLQAHAGAGRAVAVSAASRAVFTAGDDGRIAVFAWRRRPPAAPLALVGAVACTGPCTALACVPGSTANGCGGDLLVAGDAIGNVTLVHWRDTSM